MARRSRGCPSVRCVSEHKLLLDSTGLQLHCTGPKKGITREFQRTDCNADCRPSAVIIPGEVGRGKDNLKRIRCDPATAGTTSTPLIIHLLLRHEEDTFYSPHCPPAKADIPTMYASPRTEERLEERGDGQRQGRGGR